LSRVLIAGIVMAASIAVIRAEQQPTFRANVDVVRIDVSVMNGLSPVAGLKTENFVITDNGVPQTLDSASLDSVPLSLMLVLDTSGSLAGERLTNLIDAVNGLVKSLRTEDAASLLTFSEPIRLAVKTTREREPLISALTGLVADGSTSVNDAIFLALQLRPADAGESRPVLLLFSDGRDTSSWLRSDHVIEATKRSGMLVHVVELVADEWMGARGVEARPSSFLGLLADTGGGRRWFAKSSRDLRELFGKALNELRARYLLTYSPSGVSREGWHDVKVTLKNARGEVTARPGYFAQ
jgi:Ca-activated chloride channel homolog